jgi:hypothetical protein
MIEIVVVNVLRKQQMRKGIEVVVEKDVVDEIANGIEIEIENVKRIVTEMIEIISDPAIRGVKLIEKILILNLIPQKKQKIENIKTILR